MWDLFDIVRIIYSDDRRLSHNLAFLLFIPAAVLIGLGVYATDESSKWLLPTGIGLLAVCLALFVFGLWNAACENAEQQRK